MQSSRRLLKVKMRLRILIWVSTLTMLACSHAPNSASANDTDREESTGQKYESSPGRVDEDVSLKADRAHLDSLRKEISPEVRRDNDELAAILETMSRADEEPSRARSRFDSLIRKKRDQMDKDIRLKREAFSAKEKKAREIFTKAQESARNRFAKETHPSSERRDFFDSQDQKRRSFFEAASDKRKEFEERVSDSRKTFEDYVREKTDLFNQEYRGYTARYNERRNGEELKKQMKEKAARIEAEKRRHSTDTSSGRAADSQGGSNDSTSEIRNVPHPATIPLRADDESGK